MPQYLLCPKFSTRKRISHLKKVCKIWEFPISQTRLYQMLFLFLVPTGLSPPSSCYHVDACFQSCLKLFAWDSGVGLFTRSIPIWLVPVGRSHVDDFHTRIKEELGWGGAQRISFCARTIRSWKKLYKINLSKQKIADSGHSFIL